GVLVDPEHDEPAKLADQAEQVVKDGADIIFIGGSSNIDPSAFLEAASKIKKKLIKYNTPLIIYTEDFNMVSRDADAILYGSVLNSNEPRYLIKMQVWTAPLIKKLNIEPLNTAFLIFEPGGTVGHVVNYQPIPRQNKKIGLAYTLAAEMMGYRFVYLEAGSRVGKALEDDIIKLHRKTLSIPIIVGGGIKKPEKAKSLVESGASIIIIGTAFEEGANVLEFAKAIHGAKHIVPNAVNMHLKNNE
ncbi:MAG: phosphoglycerol geranylgeranyltransferase, partial [Candidatus Heimdallarchaeota archaeon]